MREGKEAEKVFLVKAKRPLGAVHRVKAVRYEIHDEHLVFLGSDDRVRALFVMEFVESWSAL